MMRTTNRNKKDKLAAANKNGLSGFLLSAGTFDVETLSPTQSPIFPNYTTQNKNLLSKTPTHPRTPFSINGIPPKKERTCTRRHTSKKEKRVTSMADWGVSLVLIIHHSLTSVNTYVTIRTEEKVWQKRPMKNYVQM